MLIFGGELSTLYGIFQKIHPSVGEGAAVMGVCPTAFYSGVCF
ncbi:hypothetical protein STRDD11_00915 [Streptococcus sp. DD11]|nr:hypothetical protein STRDD11_00915 [Streptococcus sp. DD11]